MNKIMSRTYASGFTLIEIMVVVVIIGLLAAVISPQMFEQRDKAMVVKTKSDMKTYSSALSLYRLDNFTYPTTSEGLQALVTNPGSKKNWSQYMDRKYKDPWDNDYQYVQPGQKNPNSYDLFSFGADGVAGGDGNNKDIGNWED